MKKLETLVIEFNRPRGITDAELTEYICSALKGYGGSSRPEDPLFDGLEVSAIARVQGWKIP